LTTTPRLVRQPLPEFALGKGADTECNEVLARCEQCLGMVVQRLHRCSFHHYVEVTGEEIIEITAGLRVEVSRDLPCALRMSVKNGDEGETRRMSGDNTPDVPASE